MSGVDRPLSGIRIVDLVRGPLAATTRYLAELGASVTRLDDGETEPSLDDLIANIGKARAASLTDGLLESADAIVFDAAGAVDVEALRRRRPALVTMAVSDFGTDTRFSSWKGSDLVLHALSAELSRSGIAGRPPLPPPGQLAYQCAASQAAYALTVSLYHALRTGKGDHLD